MRNLNFTNEFLSGKRLAGDELADTLIRKAFESENSKKMFYDWFQNLDTFNVYSDLPLAFCPEDLYHKTHTLPEWVNPALLKAGADFFQRYQNQIMQLLGLLSLPYCYAAADGAMVLYLTRQLSKNTAKRLMDTAQFVLSVQLPGTFLTEGKGFNSVLKIRLTHAMARYHLQQSHNWNVGWGIPVNQEDMAGTNLAFSLIVIRGLRKLGYSVSYQDQHAYLHLWSLIGFFMGIDADLLTDDGKEANMLEHRISARQFRQSEQGVKLTESLIASFSTFGTSAVSLRDVKQLMSYLLGKEVAEMLNIYRADLPRYLPLVFKTFTDFNVWKDKFI